MPHTSTLGSTHSLFGDRFEPVRHVVRGIVTRVEAWRAMRQLADADERMLRDIGLTRGDVAGALALPLADDPTLYLACLQQERRSAGHDLRREAERAWAVSAPSSRP